MPAPSPPSPDGPVGAGTSVRPGTEDYRVGDGPDGVVLCHGYTGSPWSLRGWADHLAGAGFRVSVPRLPGHGTVWTELNRVAWVDWYARVEREVDTLRRSCDHVFAGGLSMGAGLALRLAALRPDAVGALALVNPFVSSRDPRLRALPVLRRLVPSLAGVGNDVARPGADERAYDRLPLGGLAEVTRMWRDLRPRLPQVSVPVRVYRSATDHVIDPSSAALLASRLGPGDVAEVVLERSYHVATMDVDAELIFADSAALFRRVAGR